MQIFIFSKRRRISKVSVGLSTKCQCLIFSVKLITAYKPFKQISGKMKQMSKMKGIGGNLDKMNPRQMMSMLPQNVQQQMGGLCLVSVVNFEKLNFTRGTENLKMKLSFGGFGDEKFDSPSLKS